MRNKEVNELLLLEDPNYASCSPLPYSLLYNSCSLVGVLTERNAFYSMVGVLTERNTFYSLVGVLTDRNA